VKVAAAEEKDVGSEERAEAKAEASEVRAAVKAVVSEAKAEEVVAKVVARVAASEEAKDVAKVEDIDREKTSTTKVAVGDEEAVAEAALSMLPLPVKVTM